MMPTPRKAVFVPAVAMTVPLPVSAPLYPLASMNAVIVDGAER
jgi:hypothetical protein